MWSGWCWSGSGWTAAGAACHASATQRYAVCLRGQPLPPLNTWNNYAYVQGDPISYVDPMGLDATDALPLAPTLPIASGCVMNPAACVAGAVGIVLITGANPSATQGICEANKEKCDKEWEEAYAICADLLKSNGGKNDWRKVGQRPASLFSCARGYVSEACGGSKVE